MLCPACTSYQDDMAALDLLRLQVCLQLHLPRAFCPVPIAASLDEVSCEAPWARLDSTQQVGGKVDASLQHLRAKTQFHDGCLYTQMQRTLAQAWPMLTVYAAAVGVDWRSVASLTHPQHQWSLVSVVNS